VIGKIEGAIEPDRLVILGSHRDAWTMGAGDPISGTSVLLETARGIGQLLQSGWRPRRTLLFCSWDAEEFGLLGSVEFVEKYYNVLLNQAVVYLNLDIAVSGTDAFYAAGSPNLQTILAEVLDSVLLPNGNPVSSVWAGKSLELLGDGSDFTGFIQHCGISSMHTEFSSTDGRYEAVYHSNYDSFYWYTHWGDPSFQYHATIAKLYGLVALRIADDQFLPFDFVQYAMTLSEYVGDLENSTSKVNFTLLKTSSQNFLTAAQSFAQELESLIQQGRDASAERIRGMNDRMFLLERGMLGDPLLSGREWYLHVIFAPSMNDSYAGAAYPGIRDAIAATDYTKAQFVSDRISLLINGAADFLGGILWNM